MRLGYNEQIHVFEYVADYDGGYMNHDAFNSAEEFHAHINKLVAGKTEEEAKYIMNNIKIVRGVQVVPKVAEVIKTYKLEF